MPKCNMLEADIVRMQHMIDAANEALSFVADKHRADLDRDRKLVLALVKSIEIVGEAASRVSQQLKTENSQIPWTDIAAMRNRLIHGYFDVNLDIVWQTVTQELPQLIEQMQKLMPTSQT